MKILIGGGGTGGHIYPALALVRHALSRDAGTEVLFVGSAGGLENKIVPSAGYNLVTIPARGFQRNLRQIGAVVADLWRGIREAGRIINRFRPAVVLGTGGYVAAPLVISAVLKRYPVVIHEQNALPGLTNRCLAPFVKKVCLSFAETAVRMPPFSKTLFTGNPRAGEVVSVGREEGCRYFGFKPDDTNFLVYSGSRGAQKINEVVSAYLRENRLPPGVNMIYVTGEIYYQEVLKNSGSPSERVRIYPYLDKMPEALAAADLALTRSGATTLAELTALGLPALLVPSPNVVANHQYFNARLLADQGAALLIEEKDFNLEILSREVDRLLNRPHILMEMRSRSRKMGMPEAAEKLYRCLLEVAS